MKIFLIFALALAACSAETYTTENDNFDITAVVADTEALRKLTNCFIDKGECDTVGAGFKEDLGEAVEQACKKCTDAQKHIFKHFIAGLKEKLPAENQAFRNKYDPQNKYFVALEEAVAKY
uniref:Chemosensory protein n=1 Tax=Semiothisa cinerearia TaxID=2249628 RepID=A0A889XL52_9NEOP|nr:chemosensory protein [Semiothisa cinerearia]